MIDIRVEIKEFFQLPFTFNSYDPRKENPLQVMHTQIHTNVLSRVDATAFLLVSLAAEFPCLYPNSVLMSIKFSLFIFWSINCLLCWLLFPSIFLPGMIHQPDFCLNLHGLL